MTGNGFTITTDSSLTGGTVSLGDTVWPVWNEERTATTGTFIWRNWVDELSYTNGVTITPSSEYRDTVWVNWIDNGTGTVIEAPTITLGNTVWPLWIDENGRRVRARPPAGNVIVHPDPRYEPAPQPNRFQVLKEKIVSRRKTRKAKKRGRALLRSIVSDEQWKDYLRYGSIREVGEHAIYEIGTGWSGHIFKIGLDGEPQLKLCVHMAMGQYGKRWIVEDRIAAVLLALRHDEAATVAGANVHHFSVEEKRRVKARRGHKRVA